MTMKPVPTIWDLLQRGSGGAADTRSEAAGEDRATRAARQRDVFERDYVELHERMDRLALVTRAMWTLIAEKMGVADADLLKRMADLDASDGTMDGRVTAPQVRCSCGAIVSRKFNRCLFCGKEYEGGGVFDTL